MKPTSAGHLPNGTPTLPQRARATPRSAQQRASISSCRSCGMPSVGCLAMPAMTEITISDDQGGDADEY